MLANILPLASLAFALPTSHPSRDNTLQQFEITSLLAQFPVGHPYGTSDTFTSTMSISLSYPDPSLPSDTSATLLSTTCSYIWPDFIAPGSTNWTACDDSRVQWRLPQEGWTSNANYLVQVYETLSASTVSGVIGLEGSHFLDFLSPGGQDDPNAYMSCIQMGKFNPLTCTLGGPLASQSPPVVMNATLVEARPI